MLSQDSMEHHTPEDSLPELLARDLELASHVFAARSMTAGAPSYSVVSEYMARAKAAGQFTNRLSMALPYQPASARVNVLGAIKERDSMAFADQHEQQRQRQHSQCNYPDTSDMESLSSTDESAGMPPPPFRYHRNTSIITTATSVTDSVRKTSPHPSLPPTEPTTHGSWIEGDSDDDFEIEGHSDGTREPLSPLSPRPPTPPTIVDNDPFPLNYEQSAATFRTRIIHKKSHSTSGASAHIVSAMTSPLASPIVERKPRFKYSIPEFSMPKRAEKSPIAKTTVIRARDQSMPPMPSPLKLRTPAIPPPVPPKNHERISRMSEENLKQKSRAASLTARQPAITESPPISEGCSSEGEMEDDSLYGDRMSSWHDQHTGYARTTPPASPLHRSFVTLAHAAKPYVPNFHGDELARVVPLPPDVIETLRVSTACFPETILLSTSLTIDTIRSYSKKMRLPETDVMRPSPPPSPEGVGRRSLWRKVNPLKRGNSGIRSSGARSIDNGYTASIGSPDLQKTWSAIQNVFGTCSEYICDALYAHIMAYNYVSALLARNAANTPAPNTPGRTKSRRMGGRASSEQQDDIPKKAAFLLGLDDTPDLTRVPSSRLLNRRTGTATSAPWSRDELLPSLNPPSSCNAAAVRTVQDGLYKSIIRLIATARFMSLSGRLEEPILEHEATDEDILFMRSLCEIVRLVEETS